MLNVLCGCCSQQWGPTVSLQRATVWVVLEFPLGPHGQQLNWMTPTPQTIGLPLQQDIWTVETLYPPLL